MAANDVLYQWGAHEGSDVFGQATMEFIRRNGHRLLRAGVSEDQYIELEGNVPAIYDGNGLELHIWMTGTGAGDGDARISVSVEKISPDVEDIDSDSFDTANEADLTVNSVSGEFTVHTISLANDDSLAVGDEFRIRIFRDQDHANDDQTTAVEFKRFRLINASA